MKSRAVCYKPLFFPHYYISEVNALQLKAALCRCFRRWGLPRCIKVDNGRPFGDPQRSSIPELALWLLGLGVKVIWNPPRSPKDNAKVERMQGTTAGWAEVNKCSDYGSLQKALDQAVLIQREVYEVKRLGGKTRKQVYPKLWANPRRFDGGSFDIGRVYHYLKGVIFKRKVLKNGCFVFYAQSVYVGCAYSGQIVSVQFDSRKKRFRVGDELGNVFAYFAADNFNEKSIRTLNVCKGRVISAKT